MGKASCSRHVTLTASRRLDLPHGVWEGTVRGSSFRHARLAEGRLLGGCVELARVVCHPSQASRHGSVLGLVFWPQRRRSPLHVFQALLGECQAFVGQFVLVAFDWPFIKGVEGPLAHPCT